MLATNERIEIALGKENLAQAVAELNASREDSLRAQRRYQEAFTKWTEAAGAVAHLREVRTMGGRRI